MSVVSSPLAQFVTLLGQRAGLESKMIEAGEDTEPAIDARIVICRHIRNSLRFQKGNKLITPDIEKEVSKAPAFFDLDRVGDDRFKPQNTLVKFTGLVQVECREANV
jgi:hypothetical protein